MKLLRLFLMLIFLCALLLPVDVRSKENTGDNTKNPAIIKFGTIPVLQSLPLFVASQKDFFKEQGLTVEIVLFNSAMEKDIALTSDQIAGCFGDFMTPIVLQGNNSGIKIVAENFNTTSEQRMFAILASPQSKDKKLSEIAKAGIAAGSNTIADYLIVRLLQHQKISSDGINIIDVKNIPIRLQMLLSGQVAAALMPEPLATLAEMKGAKTILDDKGRGLSATVFVFSDKFINKYPQAVKAFHKAVNKASDYINKHPDEVRVIMNRDCKMPEPLQGSFPIPKFPRLAVPDRNKVTDVYNWLREKQIVTKDMTYKDMVADGYLP
jgi:NitT/TauT family transport system substrate-binding protein